MVYPQASLNLPNIDQLTFVVELIKLYKLQHSSETHQGGGVDGKSDASSQEQKINGKEQGQTELFAYYRRGI